MEVARFKKTEVGLIPESWSVEEIGNIAEVKTGPFGSALHEKDYVNDGTPIITVEHLGERGVLHEDLPLVSDKDKARLSSYLLKLGDIVFSRVGSVDRNALVKKAEDGWLFSGRLLRVRTFSNKAYPAYLSHHFHSEDFKSRVKSVAVGQTMASLNTKILKEVKVCLPPTKGEQQAIAEALSDMDATIEALEQLITKKRYIKQGTMQELLTGKRRLPGFSEAWAEKKLGDITHIKTGSRNNQDKVEDGTYPFFVRSADVERINSYSYDCEAILVPGEGNIGNIFHYIYGKFDVHQRVYVITQFGKDIWGKYVYLYMAQNFGAHAMQNSVKATVDSLRLPTFQNFVIKMPVDIEEQKAVAACLTDMIKELKTLESKLIKVRHLKQGMMQQLLTGRIRLI